MSAPTRSVPVASPTGTPNDATYIRWSALAGIGWFITFLIAPIATGGGLPTANASPQTITDYYVQHHTRILIANFAGVVGTLFFTFFIAALWRAVHRVDDTGVLGVTMLLAAASVIALEITGRLIMSGLILRAITLQDPALVRALFDIRTVAFDYVWLPVAVIVGVPSLLSLRRPMLPRWLGWAGIVVASLALVGSLAVFPDTSRVISVVNGSDFVLFALWILITSIALYRGKYS